MIRASNGQQAMCSEYHEEEEVWIGRAEPEHENQIEFKDSTIARFHLRIYKIPDGGPFVFKQHAASTTKVFLQGVRVYPGSFVVLFPGAIIHLGDPLNGNYGGWLCACKLNVR